MTAYSVLDFFGTGKYYDFEPIEKTDARKLDEACLPMILVSPKNNSNKQSYVIDSSHVILDDLVIHSPKGIYIDESQAVDLRMVLSSLDKDSDNTQKLRDWFHAISPFFGNKILKASEIIIPIPDRFSAYSQDKILEVSRKEAGKKTTLLWRSVAAFLGNIEKIGKPLNKYDRVAVVDVEATGTTITYLWIDECDGYEIPAHRLFLNSDTGDIRYENYPFNRIVDSKYLGPKIPYKIIDGMLSPAELSSDFTEDPFYGIQGIARSKPSAVIAIGALSAEIINTLKFFFRDLVIDVTGESIAYGAACFANCKSNGITAYYDECEALSLVVADRKEKYQFKTLIAANRKLRSGLKIKGETVDGIFLRLDSKTADFHLRLGEPKRNLPLKSLSQKYEIPEEFRNDLHGKTIELKLFPTLDAGQGRASVEISPKENKYMKVINPVLLDWEKMQDANTTLAGLEENMERSFPPDIPYVKKKRSGNLSREMCRDIEHFILNNVPLTSTDLNKSQWPNKNSNDISRFVRENLFGVPTEDDDGLPMDSKQKDLCLRFFNTIDKRFNNAKNSDLVTLAAWTYHPKEVPYITEYMRNKAKCFLQTRYYSEKISISQGEASFYANMFITRDDGVLFMKAFFKKLSTGSYYKGVDNANHWYRAAYQIMMSNPDVFEVLANDIGSIYSALDMLICSYYDNFGSANICSNIYKVLCFMLKLRGVCSGFCRASDGKNKTIDDSYFILLNLLSSEDEDSVRAFLVRYFELRNKIAECKGKIFDVYKAVCNQLQDCRFEIIDECAQISVDNVVSLSAFGEKQLRYLVQKNAAYKRESKGWDKILNLYLNGKGNLSIPIADL